MQPLPFAYSLQYACQVCYQIHFNNSLREVEGNRDVVGTHDGSSFSSFIIQYATRSGHCDRPADVEFPVWQVTYIKEATKSNPI